MLFKKLLIANRGEIACRILRSAQSLGIHTVAVYSEADRHTPHVHGADEAYCLGPAPVAQSYLRYDKIIALCKEHGIDAIHPGYGLLSENLAFAEACENAGIIFVGPTPLQIDKFGLKHTARELAQASNVPMLPGTGLLASVEEALEKADVIGYPVMLKSAAGGGGIGMKVCANAEELKGAYDQVEHLSKSNFGQGGMYIEKFVTRARHVEVQIFGDGEGNVLALGERDCSTQRRNQKVIEETPAPGLSEAKRQELCDAAVRLAESVKYRSAGTVEFLFDAETDQFYFLEVNTRLQVEHGVTEEVTGIDLVEWMLLLAGGKCPDLQKTTIEPLGHSIQVRVYAEDPLKDFQPSCGVLNEVHFPPDVRCDTWISRGTEVTPNYDPLLAKIIVKGKDREEALEMMSDALEASALYGIETNLDYLAQIVKHPLFQKGGATTALLKSFDYKARVIEVIAPGTQTSIQDYPGRLGYWDIGVPPSGPMDSLAFRLANKLVGNLEGVAGLEITVAGPTLKFHTDTIIALTGAYTGATLDGKPMPFGTSVAVRAGSILQVGSVTGAGCRAYLAVYSGFDVADYLGSKSTFSLGQFGGHAGRCLLAGDILHLQADAPVGGEPLTLSSELIPTFSNDWEVRVTYGPHGAPDFFQEEDIEVFFSTAYEIHYNSARTGLRLIGPKPKWARKDGGEAGLHPSNLHDNPYAIGAINFTGDMPIILGPDGPSLGGFVCPATIIKADLWMIGQFRPGDKIRFVRVSQEEANLLEKAQNTTIANLDQPFSPSPILQDQPLEDCIYARLTEEENPIAVTYRPCGDKYLLIEYGPILLDLDFRFRAHALMEWIKSTKLPGIIDVTPGVRSLQLHYDSTTLSLRELVDALISAEKELPDVEDMVVPSRIVHLPLSWDDPNTKLGIQKYMQSIRKEAPWLPSNIEFIRRINGMDSVEDVRQTVYDASYLVLGLGDVYLGAPAAVPLDPRHRLLTTKYNPARTWTAENGVGIGGVFMCIYGMESPGGYQLVGQTLQIWNRYKTTPVFAEGKPWLLRFFDQVRYFPVEHSELEEIRRDFVDGKYQIKVEETTFSRKEYSKFLTENAASIQTFQEKQQAAFLEERNRWEAEGQNPATDSWEPESPPELEGTIPDGHEAVASHISGNVWKLLVNEGDAVKAGQSLAVLEAMKMEIPVIAPSDGSINRIMTGEGKPVKNGQNLFLLKTR